MCDDENLKELNRYLGESLKIKIFLFEYFKFINNIISEYLKLNLFEKESLLDLLRINTQVYRNHSLKIEEFNSQFELFISKNETIYRFIIENDFDPSLIYTSIKFQYEFIDLILEDRIDEHKISEFQEQITILKEERKALYEFSIFLKKKINQLSKCYFCGILGFDNLGFYKCVACQKNLCEEHIFAGNMCDDCARIFIDEQQENIKK